MSSTAWGGEGVRCTESAMNALMRYPWPGNIRELLSLMERMAIVANHMAEVTDWEQLLLSLWKIRLWRSPP